MTSVLSQAGTTTLGGMNDTMRVQDIQSRIRSEVWRKQIRMKIFFEDYDKLRRGYCIQDKFITGLSCALNILSITLTSQQIKLICDKYRIIPPGDLIKWISFINNIDQQFSDPQLAKRNLQELKQNKQIIQNDIKTLDDLLKYIKWMVSSQRIFIKQLLQDYDRTKSSYITRQQFIRVLDNLNLVRNQQLVDILCRKYCRSINPKEINYVDFIKDVQDITQLQSFVLKGIVNNDKTTNKVSNVISDINQDSITEQFYVDKKLPDRLLPIKDVLKKIQAQVTLRRIRVRQFFLDFDGLRKNIVTGQQFKRVLSTLGIQLSNSEYQQILKMYGVDSQYPQRIHWMDFCQDVDEVFTKKWLDKIPLHRVKQIDSTVFQPVKHIAIHFTAQEQQLLANLITDYEKIIQHKRILMKPLFEDYDITKIGYVTKNQFIRILKQFDLVPKLDRLLNLLLKKYMDKQNLNEVNYYKFIRDVDHYNEQTYFISKNHANSFINYQHKPKSNLAYIKNENPDDLEDLFGNMRRKIKQERIRVAEFMKDFDKLKHGNITKEQFRLALNMAKLPLSEKQFQLIIENYQCQNKPNYIKWKQFCDTLDLVFNARQLEKTKPNFMINLAKTDFKYGRQPITTQQLEIANQVKIAFKQFQLANRLDIKQMFENWDKLNRWKVSTKQFRQVLATLGFNLTDQQSRCITKVYLTDDEKQVKYLQFLKDTKPYDFSYMTEIKDVVKRGTGKIRVIPDNIQDILFQLRRTTKINRLRYKEYFKDFDLLNKGTLKKNKFKSVIYQTMKIPLDQRMFSILEKHYENEDDSLMLNYWKFCDDLDIVFNLPDRQKNPLIKPDIYDYTILHSKKIQQNIDSLMLRLGQVVRKHRLLLKPFFQDKDISKIGRVSFTRMRSILDNNKIPLTEFQYSLLCNNFAYDNDEFNYIDFIEALKKYEEDS